MGNELPPLTDEQRADVLASRCGKCGYTLGQTLAAALGERLHDEQRPADMCPSGQHDSGTMAGTNRVIASQKKQFAQPEERK